MSKVLVLVNKFRFQTIFLFSLISVVILFKVHFNFNILIPTNIYWLMGGYDWSTHFLGWQFFRFEPWTFPLGNITNYFYPLGSNVGYTDSIPLMAFLFKLLSPVLPKNFQYIGLWFLICFVLQALFATLLVKNLKTNIIGQFIAVQFFIFSPILLVRFAHPSLNAHWIILASLWIYLLDYKKYGKRKILIYQFIILFLSAFIHPYLCVFVLAFTLILLIKFCFINKIISLIKFFAISFISLFVTFLLWFVIGYIDFGNKLDYGLYGYGYGIFSMNLNSLINPANSSVNPLISYPHSVIPELPVLCREQGFEGYNYLGLGMIILAIYMFISLIVKYKKKCIKKFRKYVSSKKSIIPLLVISLIFTVYAISNKIAFNDKIIIQYGLPDFCKNLFSAFQSSGRFFWPVYYLLIFTVLFIVTNKNKNKTISTIIIIAAFVIQIIDISPLINKWNIENAEYRPPIKEKVWNKIFQDFDKIAFYPALSQNYNHIDDYVHFAYLAANNKKPIDVGYVARTNYNKINNYLETFEKNIDNENIDQKTVYVTIPQYFDRFSSLIDKNKMLYTYLDGYYVMFSKKSNYIPPQGFCHKKVSLETLTQFINKNEHNILIISVKDEATNKLSMEFKDYMKNLNSNINNLLYRGSYISVIANKKLILEKINNTDSVQINISANSKIKGIKIVKPISIISAGCLVGNFSSIKIDNKELSKNRRGLNIVVLDNKFNVLETVNFDTFKNIYLNNF